MHDTGKCDYNGKNEIGSQPHTTYTHTHTKKLVNQKLSVRGKTIRKSPIRDYPIFSYKRIYDKNFITWSRKKSTFPTLF